MKIQTAPPKKSPGAGVNGTALIASTAASRVASAAGFRSENRATRSSRFPILRPARPCLAWFTANPRLGTNKVYVASKMRMLLKRAKGPCFIAPILMLLIESKPSAFSLAGFFHKVSGDFRLEQLYIREQNAWIRRDMMLKVAVQVVGGKRQNNQNQSFPRIPKRLYDNDTHWVVIDTIYLHYLALHFTQNLLNKTNTRKQESKCQKVIGWLASLWMNSVQAR